MGPFALHAVLDDPRMLLNLVKRYSLLRIKYEELVIIRYSFK
jgi:hypothetical protein